MLRDANHYIPSTNVKPVRFNAVINKQAALRSFAWILPAARRTLPVMRGTDFF
jgi:hypothetical protein